MSPSCRLVIWATLSEHTEKDWGPIRSALRRFILGSADAVLVNGKSGARYIKTLAPRAKVQIVNQPVTVEPFAKIPLERGGSAARRLLYSGRLIAQKGVFELQRAIASRARRRPGETVEITWAGDGDDLPALQGASMPPNVQQVFTGHLSYEELLRHYAESGALVLPTYFDEWGLVINEALVSGLPVIGSIFSQAVEELVEDGKTGWVFDPRDEESFARVLDAFLDSPPPQLDAMRARARQRGLQVTISGAADCIMTGAHAALESHAVAAA